MSHPTRSAAVAVVLALVAGLGLAVTPVVAATPARRTPVAPLPSEVVSPAVAGTGFLLGPDVSKWQHTGGSIDWHAVAASGTSFAFVKATEGFDGVNPPYTNPFFASDFAGAGGAGLYRGAYHMARPALPLSTAGDQARQFVGVTGVLHGALDLPPVLDLEHNGGLSPADLTSWASTWLATVQQLTGRLPMIYVSPGFWSSALANTTSLANYPLWIARWTTAPDPLPLPGGWTSWLFWQYTSTGTLPGIVGNVDISRFCCSPAKLAAVSGSPQGRPQLFLRNSATTGVADETYVFGAPAGGTTLMCDWNGDGVDTPGVFRNGTWFLTNATTGGLSELDFGYGGPGDIPICGDWNGDGADTPGVVRNGVWFLVNSLGKPFADLTFGYGNPGDVPVVGDWNGDGTDTPGVKRGPVWYLVNTAGKPFADLSFGYGNPGDVGVVGDWNGSGRDSVGVKRGAWWYLVNTAGKPFADIVASYGEPGDVPVTGRWLPTGPATIGVVRPTF